jgi:hypothetical protein
MRTVSRKLNPEIQSTYEAFELPKGTIYVDKLVNGRVMIFRDEFPICEFKDLDEWRTFKKCKKLIYDYPR